VRDFVFLMETIAPGLGMTFWLYAPGRLALPVRLALVAAFGYITVASLAFALAATATLSLTTLVAGWSIMTVAIWALALRRFSIPGHFRTIGRQLSQRMWTDGLGVAIICAFCLYRLVFPSSLALQGAAALRYWSDGAEVATAGHFPSEVLQWGMQIPATASKAFLNSFMATAALIFDGKALDGLGAVQWFSAIALALVLWGLGKVLGLKRLAIALPLLTLASPHFLNDGFTHDLLAFRAELLGRVVGFAGLIVGIRALRGRSRWVDPLATGAVIGAAALTHFAPLIVVFLLLGSYALTTALRSFDPARMARTLGIAVLVTVAVYGIARATGGGTLGFQGIKNPRAYSAAPAARETATGKVTDPTLFFASPLRALRGNESSASSELSNPGEVYRAYVTSALGAESPAIDLIFPLLLLLGGAAVYWRLPGKLKELGPAAVILMTGILLFSWAMTVRYQTFVPGTTGSRRLADYASLPVLFLLLAALEFIVSRLGSRVAKIGPALLFVALTVICIASNPPPSDRVEKAGVALQGIHWIASHSPCDAVILSNFRTEGTFEALANRPALLEGMSPYFRPAILNRVNELNRQAYRFFTRPASDRAFLKQHDVAYVYFVLHGPLGGSPIAYGGIQRLGQVPFLRKIYGNSLAQIFRVKGTPRPVANNGCSQPIQAAREG
jgi:hypothetical protein